MRSGFFCALKANNKKRVNRLRAAGLSFFVFLLLLSSTTQAVPTNTNPIFVYGPSQTIHVCAGVPNDISSWLAVIDPDFGQTETWSISEGAVTGLPATASSGGTVTPTGVFYTPGTGVTNDFLEIEVSDGIGEPVTIFLIVDVNPQPSVILGANPAVCAGADSASILYSGLMNVGPDTVVFDTVGNAIPWTVPAGVTSLQFDVQGARGGRQNATPGPYMPGYGGRVQGTLTVTPGQQLFFNVGGVGADGSTDGANGGVGGGGNSNSFIYGSGGGGGGASGISFDGSWLVIAGGGGGDGWDSTGDRAGGAGGGLIGGNSAINGGGSATNFAAGGSQLAGGAGAAYPGWATGSDGSAFRGGDGSTQGISGGGGGGYYGGGGGVWTGGGGGSSYTDPDQVTAFTHTSGYDSTNGIITITYVIPGTYSIVWSDSAHAHGFVDVTADTIPASAFPIVLPASAPAAVYSGSLTVSSATCSSTMNPFRVKVKPIPSVNLYSGQTVCNGDSTNDITFSGGPAGVVFNWVNDNTDFGLGPNGTTKIARFAPVNPFNYTDSATITVTPVDSGCTGESMSFVLKDNPVPRLNSTLVPHSICDSTLFNYHPTTTVTDPGTTYAWSRATIAGITNTGTTGADDVSEILVNAADTSIPVDYQYVLNFMGCMDTQNVVVNVYPHPMFTSRINTNVCSGATLSYEPTSNVALTDFAWSRALQYGISNSSSAGAGGPEEVLMDTTASPQSVEYVFTLTPTGSTCNYMDTLIVRVNPTPVLNTPLNAGSNCTSDTFTYIPGSNTVGTAFTWSREENPGLSNPGLSDSGVIHELLINPNTYPVIVSYTYFLTANGCPNSQTVTDTVKPTPVLNSTLTPDSICNNTVFTYTATSLTAGTGFAWVRDSVSGITESADSALSASISEVLNSTQPGVVTVTYVYTLTAQGCSNVQDVAVKVNPTPELNNNPSVATTCDNTTFNFTPGSNTSGATYSWTRLYVPGIENLGTSSTGSTGVINESLDNTTYVNVNTTYYYTITANGCSNTENVVLTVHPDPKLSTDTTATICSGAPFNYYPDSYTPTTTYTWSNTSVPGISPTGVSGAGNVSAVFTSSLTTAATVVYTYTLTAYGCTNTENVTVTVNPTPSLVDITVHPSNSACDNTLYQNFGAAVPPGPGMTYNWVVDNGYVWAKGTDGQYCLVNFNNPGTAVVYLFINDSLGCQNNNGFTVAVSSAANINPEVIYFNQQLICKDADVDNYQWGYDDAVTLDSTAIAGANNQNYSIANLETGSRYYWVITNRGGCTQKTYYNAPASTTGIANVNANQPEMKIFPNPAAEYINVELLNMTGGNVNVTITNMLGQKVSSVMTAGSEAKIDVTGLPAGCYMVDCYGEGVKIAGAKFIKN